MKAQPESHKSKESVKTVTESWYRRRDICLWLIGIASFFILVLMIQVTGSNKGWNAKSGYTHNTTENSQNRFLPEPYITEEGIRGRYGPDAAKRWYYWQLKPELRTFWTHFFPWTGYACHQILIWATIYVGQIEMSKEPIGRERFTSKLNHFNLLTFFLNLAFHLIHFMNTQITYDGTAPDVSIASSQASVVTLLVLVAVLEYKERGLFFRWPLSTNEDKVSKKLLLNYGPAYLVRKYHGYAFAWAAIYTLWYHPMENTWGHIMGFAYTWMIMLQGSLMYTNIHLNKYWRVLQEMFVIIHGGVIATQTGGGELMGTRLWPMFIFGYGLCFVLTQVFSLPFWSAVPAWCRFIPFLLYSSVVIWSYSWIPNQEGKTWVRMPEILRIPMTYYLLFAIAWILLYSFLKLDRIIFNKNQSNVMILNEKIPVKKVFQFSAAMMVFALNIALGLCAQLLDWKIKMVALLSIFNILFVMGCCIAFMCLKYVLPEVVGRDPVCDHYINGSDIDKVDNNDLYDGKNQHAYTTERKISDVEASEMLTLNEKQTGYNTVSHN